MQWDSFYVLLLSAPYTIPCTSFPTNLHPYSLQNCKQEYLLFDTSVKIHYSGKYTALPVHSFSTWLTSAFTPAASAHYIIYRHRHGYRLQVSIPLVTHAVTSENPYFSVFSIYSYKVTTILKKFFV